MTVSKVENGTVSSEGFWRSPLRWVVFVHVVLLAVLLIFLAILPSSNVIQFLDLCLVLAQVSLLMIWMTLDEKTTVLRAVKASFVVTGIIAVHMLAMGSQDELLGAICLVPASFLVLTILSLPLLFAQSFGLRLRRFHPARLPAPRPFQFSIRGLLWATVGLAVLFGLKDFAFNSNQQPGAQWPSIGEVVATLVAVLVLNGLCLSVPLVCVWVALTPGKILPRSFTAGIGWGMGAILLVHYMEDPSWSLNIPALPAIGGTLILLATLFSLRRLDYRVVWLEGEGWFPVEEVKDNRDRGGA